MIQSNSFIYHLISFHPKISQNKKPTNQPINQSTNPLILKIYFIDSLIIRQLL